MNKLDRKIIQLQANRLRSKIHAIEGPHPEDRRKGRLGDVWHKGYLPNKLKGCLPGLTDAKMARAFRAVLQQEYMYGNPEAEFWPNTYYVKLVLLSIFDRRFFEDTNDKGDLQQKAVKIIQQFHRN